MPREHNERKPKKEKFRNEHQCLFAPTLDEEQTAALQEIHKNDITVLIGKAGSGKTYTACAAGLQMLLQGQVDKIIMTRSTVSTDDLGFLPGGLEEKFLPYLSPITCNFEKLYAKPHIDAFIKQDRIQMVPLQFTRGITYDYSFVIIDEAQNMDIKQLKMCLSRIGSESKIVLLGDLDQCDLKRLSDSGLPKIIDFNIEGFGVIELLNEHRKPIVIDLLNEFKKIGA